MKIEPLEFFMITSAIIITIAILAFTRKFICWIFKIDERIKLQTEMNILLQKLISKGQSFDEK